MNRMDGKGEGSFFNSGEIFDFLAQWSALTITAEGRPVSTPFEAAGSGVSKGVAGVDEH
jgi:hypothetical protein